MKKSVLFFTIILLFSCGSSHVSDFNTKIINNDRDQLVNNLLESIGALNLTEQQYKGAKVIYSNSIDYLITNAKREKAGEVNKGVSLKNIEYAKFMAQKRIEALLTSEQLANYQNNIKSGQMSGLNKTQLIQANTDFKAKGYDVGI